MFAAIIPTRPIVSNFDCIDPTHYVLTIERPQSVELFTIALLQPLPQQDMGIGVYKCNQCITCNAPTNLLNVYVCTGIYLSLSPFTEFAYCGMMCNNSPSAACWNVLRNKLSDTTDSMRIGLSVESLSHLNTLVPEDMKQYTTVIDDAKLIALNLVQFIQSWTNDAAFEKAVQRWVDKFEQKHKLNPFFFRKP